MPAAITCTSCNRPLRVPESVLGQTVQCPLCLDEFTAQADPAAEAATRAAEPAPRRAAANGQAFAARVEAEPEQAPLAEVEAEPVEVEPVAEAVPAGPAARPAGPRRALVFPVVVTRDPDRVLRGPMDGELTAEGLHLRKMRQPPAFAAVGGRTRYLGTNRLTVTVEGREVELTIVKPWTSTHHLAKDTAAFLGGKGGFPDARGYRLPWHLYAMPWVFLALPFAAIPLGLLTDGCLGAFLWVVITAAMIGGTFAVISQAWLRPRARLIGAAAMLGVGAAVFLVSIPLTPPYTVDASLWKTYSPAGGFSVLMPGTPKVSALLGMNAGQKYTVDVDSPDIHFTVFVTPVPVQNNGFNPFVSGGPNAQAYNDATNLLNRELYISYANWWPYRDGYQRQPYHEAQCQVPSGYGGPAAGKTVAARIYVVGDKVYTLAAVGPRVKLDAPDVLKFFNSVQFTGSGTPMVPQPGETAITGKVVRADAGRLVVKADEKEWNLAVPANANVLIGGIPGQVTDLKKGAAVTVFERDGVVTRVETKAVAAGQPASPVGWNGLVAYWSFDDPMDARAAVVLDDSDKLAAGTPHQLQSVADGARGAAMHFNGPGSSFDFSDFDPTFPARSDFSFAGWVRTRAAQGVVLSNRRNEDGLPLINVLLVNGTLRAQVRKDGSRFNLEVAGKAVNDGAWHHFAVTRRNGGFIGLYIDGALQGEQNGVAADGPITINLRGLGAELYEQKHNPRNNAPFTGDLDEFCVFDRALSLDEVQKLAGVGP